MVLLVVKRPIVAPSLKTLKLDRGDKVSTTIVLFHCTRGATDSSSVLRLVMEIFARL